METQDTIKVTGRIKFELFDSSGNVKDIREVNNVVVTVGKTYLAAWLIAATQADYFMRYIGLGEGVTGPAAGDTTLESPLATRVAGTLTSATNVWQNVALFGPGVDTGSITESGIFSVSSGGTMLARQVFGVITKAAGDSLQVTWQITLA
jgi:hypothetical protein